MLDLIERVRRETDDGFGPDDRAGGRRGEIVLAAVDAVRAREPRDIGAIVDDHARARGMRTRDDLARDVEKSAARYFLRAQLNQRCAALQESGRKVDQRPPRTCSDVSVEDCVQARKDRLRQLQRGARASGGSGTDP